LSYFHSERAAAAASARAADGGVGVSGAAVMLSRSLLQHGAARLVGDHGGDGRGRG